MAFMVGLVPFAAALWFLYRLNARDIADCATVLGLAPGDERPNPRYDARRFRLLPAGCSAGTMHGCPATLWSRSIRHPRMARRRSRGSEFTVLELTLSQAHRWTWSPSIRVLVTGDAALQKLGKRAPLPIVSPRGCGTCCAAPSHVDSQAHAGPSASRSRAGIPPSTDRPLQIATRFDLPEAAHRRTRRGVVRARRSRHYDPMIRQADGARSEHPPRRLRDPRSGWIRRHGRGLPGPRHTARPHRRTQSDQAGGGAVDQELRTGSSERRGQSRHSTTPTSACCTTSAANGRCRRRLTERARRDRPVPKTLPSISSSWSTSRAKRWPSASRAGGLARRRAPRHR